MMAQVTHLIVDSGAFIKNAPISDYAENVYTIEDAVKEIRDKPTRERLQVLPYELKLREPSPESIKYVSEFSKKTGDYGSLSSVDLRIIALTYQMEQEFVGTDHLNKEPTCEVSNKSIGQLLEGFYFPKEGDESLPDCESFPSEEVSDNMDGQMTNDSINEFRGNLANNNTSVTHDDLGINENSADIGDESEENVDESWITPQNLSEVQKKMGHLKLDSSSSSDVKVACLTTDFSIQNVLMQMGIHVLSVDGMIIKHNRVYILRCFACFRTTNIMTKQFCPNCGNKTLKRVSVSVSSDGSREVHINFRRKINIRGMKFSLPLPEGGKHAQNPILCADQPVPQNRPSKKALQKMDVFSPDYSALSSPFAAHDVYSRAASLGIYGVNRKQNYRKNPNQCSRKTGNKHK